MSEAVREMGYRGHLYGPGDMLTLLYLFHPNRNREEDDVLAAKALIYNKLITKEEISESSEPFPHTLDELKTASIVRHLSLGDCQKLFPQIKRASTEKAREVVQHYVKKEKGIT
jgi:hypothetical protein